VTDTEATVDFASKSDSQFYRVLALPPAERGRVLSVTNLGSYTTLQITFILSLADVDVTPEHPVDLHKFLYETIDAWGGRTVASGLLVVPQGLVRPLPLVSYQHGTVTETNDVPSRSLAQTIPGIGLATLGYATALPDFLGLGDSPGFHPYHHARSEASAAIDLLRAVRSWSATNSLAFNDQVFLCGYSQGGHATMALHRELQTYHTAEFTVTASAPMAGAHDLSQTTLDDFLSGRELPNPYYVAYFLAAYQDVYQITNSWSDWLVAPYDSILPPLLENRVPGSEININMPSNATLIFKPEVLEALRNDVNHPLRLALRDNDVLDWKPQAPMRMWHCQNDMDVLRENSEVALATFHSLGATQVELLDPSPMSGHGGCVLPSFLAMRDWFDTLRQ
jgi:dienelactone hydrolase